MCVASEANELGGHRVLARTAATRENVVIGPYSAWLALAMTSTGAAGTTMEEMAAALGFPLEEPRLLPAMNALDRGPAHRADDDAVKFTVANRLWGQQGTEFLAPFLDSLVTHFGAPLVATDFAGNLEAARAQVNRWVNARTQNRIPELFPEGSLDASVRLEQFEAALTTRSSSRSLARSRTGAST